jgi:hypothetical protein
MARARRVPGIRPKRDLGYNARRVVEARLEEFLSWRKALEDEDYVQELHDMRIAAKRLRYALEMFDVCFPESKPLLKELTAMQDELGELHDLDVLVAVLRSRLAPLDREIEEESAAIMGAEDGSPAEKGRRIRQLLARASRDRRRVGLIGLIGDKVAERRRRYAALQGRCAGVYLDGLAQRIWTLTEPDHGQPAIATDPNEGSAPASLELVGHGH